jgi:N6-adenosine-specific RNA methylase IME4
MLVWDKVKMGLGKLFRFQCEFCLMAIKGKPIFNNNYLYRDLLTEPRREHSRKPDAFYELVEDLCIGRKLDMFSRTKRPNWDMLGKEEF